MRDTSLLGTPEPDESALSENLATAWTQDASGGSSHPDVAFTLAVQADGKIVAAGGAALGRSNPKWALARYNTDGSLDTSFSANGKLTTDCHPGRR
jgi:Domain of unknown function (DUF5122) beta-propeller